MRQGGSACSVVVVIGLLERAVEDEDEDDGDKLWMTEDGVVGEEAAEVMGTEVGAEVDEVGVTLGDARGLCMKKRKKRK